MKDNNIGYIELELSQAPLLNNEKHFTMLTQETTQQPDAIETLFCKPFEKLRPFPMTQELTETMLQLMLRTGFSIPQDQKPLLFQVIEKRVQHCFTFTLQDQRLILFLCLLCETPGAAVMYLTYLQYWCKKHNVSNLDFDIFCQRVFPMGFPAKEELSKLWDSTKVAGRGHSDNLVDYPMALSSIQLEKTA